jgi:hypothetical protein
MLECLFDKYGVPLYALRQPLIMFEFAMEK